MAYDDGETLQVQKGITVVGAGNWGSSLASGIVRAGLPLAEVVVRNATRRRAPGGVAAVAFDQARLDAEVIWICVQDDEIASVSQRIAQRRRTLRGQIVVHSSGALTASALDAVRAAGARVGSVAPVFSFPSQSPVPLEGVLLMVESGPKDSRRLMALARGLGGKPLRVSSEKKVLYHAAATLASPLLVSELAAAVETAGLAGLTPGEAKTVVGVLASATLRNFSAKGSARSFSGPFARGDAGTVELHLRALLKHPKLHRVYLGLARNAVATLPVRNRAGLRRVLDSADEAAYHHRVRD